MFCLGKFECVFECLKKRYCYGCYVYPDPLNSSLKFSKCTKDHFDNVKKNAKYGIYVVRKMGCNNVLYIGKGGTIDNDGKFKKQDIPGRLKAVRSIPGILKAKRLDISANKWFENLYKCQGNLLIEYIILPEDGRPSPTLVEAMLLQAYFNDNQRLPLKNEEL